MLGIFPGRNGVIWRDWYTHGVVDANSGSYTTLAAPLGHINVHIRDGSAILLHAQPAYTIAETREGPYSLLISLSAEGQAFGTAYIDDGISSPPGPNKILTFTVAKGQARISVDGPFDVVPRLQQVTVLGVDRKPSKVFLQGKSIKDWKYIEKTEELIASDLDGDLNKSLSLVWL